jgi:DNA-binding response OmpR family regulator
VILTTSGEERDIAMSYEVGANSFVTKPADFNDLVEIVNNLGEYWFGLVELPPHREGC